MLALLGSKGCVARFGAHEPWREPQHTDSPTFTTVHPRMRWERYWNNVAATASTSSMIAGGNVSTLRALRTDRSKAQG